MWSGSALGRGKSLDAERVNIGFKQASQRIINHSVPLYAILAVECCRYDRDIEMTLAVLGASVTLMQMTLILDQ